MTITHTSGYIVDGICDSIGFLVFWFSVFVYSYNRQNTTKSNVLLSHSTYSLLQAQPSASPARRQLIKYYLLVLAQMTVSAMFWNLFLDKYQRMLDPNLKVGSGDIRSPLQEEVFKASLMFTIMWL